MCLLDWQHARFASPAIDVLHVIFTSTDKQLRDKEYANLLDHYYRTLTENIARLGGNPLAFSRRNFDEQLREFGKLAIIIALFMIQVIFESKMGAPDSDRSNNNAFSTLVNDEGYRQRIQDVVKDMHDLGFYIV